MRAFIFASLGLIFLVAVASTSLSAETPLLLFGGRDHKVFLGCLNCGHFEAGSVCNSFGEHGSQFSGESIWNPFGDYGSQFNSYSPWNQFASDPPVVVDHEGQFYGYFTANRMHLKRTRIEFFLIFLNNVDEVNEDLERARGLFCKE
jgi:hypothetical protein